MKLKDLLQKIPVHSLKFRLYSKNSGLSPELISVDNQFQVLENAVTPLYGIPYEKQLQYKDNALLHIIRYLRKRILGMRNSQLVYHGISPSPITEHYRSKDEFNVRMGVDGDPITYGLFTGKLHGEPYSVRPKNLIITKSLHNKILEVFELFVKRSHLPPCYSLDDGGYWRRAVVRSNSRNETMLIIVNHPRNRKKDEILEEQRSIVDHFDSYNCHVDSIYHQLCEHVRCTRENSILKLIHGVPYLYDDILGYKFRISPNSFFQINVKAAELLHKEIIKFSNFKNTTTVLDLCCGVGTFSISASSFVRNCIGIDNNMDSIEDAIHNTSINNIKNCQFFIGTVETKLNMILNSTDLLTDIVVIANPGRNGLHPRVITLLRNHPLITRIVYISCQPDSVLTKQNFIDLMKSDKLNNTTPFLLTNVKAIDLFPHTFHYEVILLFEKKNS